MMSLLAAEIRRVASRRLVRLTALVALLAVIGGGILAFARSSSISEATFRARQEQATEGRQAQRAQVEACLRAHGQSLDSDTIPQAVARECFPKLEVTAHDPRFHRTRLKGVLQGVSGVLLIVTWALGASIVGAEFSSRSMTTLLTWESRRTRVFVAKTVAVLVTMGLFAGLVLVLTALAMLPALLAHGAPGHGEPAFATIAGVIARGTALAALGAAMGFAIATIGRNTAFALGVGFAYIVVLENILGSSIAGWRRWLLLGNVIVFVSGQTTSDIAGRSVAGAAIFLTLVAVALLVAGATTFRVREVS